MHDRPRHPLRFAWLVAVGVVLAATAPACGVQQGDDIGPRSTPRRAGESARTTTTSTPDDIGPVAPASVPEGFRALNAPGIGVGLAVPEPWETTSIDPDDLTASERALAEADPQLSALIEQAKGMLSGAEVLAARSVAPVSELAAVVQLDLSLRSVPALFADEVRQQMENAGGEDVTTERLAVPGLEPDARALRVDATLPVAGQPVRVHEVIVPTSAGLAIVVVRADETLADRILSTLAAA